MKRLITLLLALGLTACSSYSQSASSRDALNSEIDANLPSGTGAVTAAQLRATLKDIVASAYNPQSDSGGLTSGDGNLTLTGTFPNQVITFTGSSGGGTGDMLKSIYDTNNDGIVDVAATVSSISWANVTSKPTIDQLLPSQTGKSAYVLTSNGSVSSWQPAPSGGGGSGTGDMLKSIYDTNNDGIVDTAASANFVQWVNVSGKPTFATSATTDTTNAANITSGTFLAARYGSNTIPLAAIAASGTPTGATVLTGTGWASIAGGTDNTRRTLSQTAHGFTPKTAIYYNGSSWVPAVATSSASAEAIALVESVTDANNFVAVFSGVYTPVGGGLTPGANYFVDANTPGNIVTTEPTAAGQVGKPVMSAISATQGIVNFQRSLQTDNQAQNLVYASPVSGTGAPDWRSLVAADLPLNSSDQVLPSQTGNTNKVLRTNGTYVSWSNITTTVNQWTAIEAQFPATGAGTVTTQNNIKVVDLPKTGTTTPGVFFVGAVPNNTLIPFGFHVIIRFWASTNSGNVQFNCAIENLGTHVETSDNYQTGTTLTVGVNTSAYKGNTATYNIGAIPALDSVGSGAPYRVLIQRNNGSGSDTCTGDVLIYSVEVQAY